MSPTISILGKSTVPKASPSYTKTEELAYQLTASGYTIRHGGYAGGLMEAAADGATRAILEHHLPSDHHIGVPETRFDRSYARTQGHTFLDPAQDICDRLRHIILAADALVIAPRGGDGTMLELQLALHENTLSASQGWRVRPIILLELPNETPWSAILTAQLHALDNGIDGPQDCPWIIVTHSVEEAHEQITKLVPAI